MSKEVNSLRDQVTQLQGSQDHLEERLMAIEAQRQERQAEAREAATPEADERPRLKVVRLVPESGPGAEASLGADGDEGFEEAAPPAFGQTDKPPQKPRARTGK